MKTLITSCIAFSCLMIAIIPAKAQQQIDPCGFERAVDHMENQYPGYKDAIDYTIKKANSKSRKTTNDSILEVPVVVHVVHENQTENLHDSLIHNQIEVLNRSFRRNNPDTVDTRPVFDSLAGDPRIEFYLAEKKPNGDSTSGITRTQTTKGSFFSFSGGIDGIDEIKSDADGGKSPWPTDQYLNLWVGDLSIAGNPGVLGFAYPPMGAPDSMWPQGQLADDSSVAGVVVHYEAFGKNNPLTTGPQLGRTDEGGTAVHEVGHYLGLRHISGDGGCSASDYIDDTPKQNGGSGGGLGGQSGHHQTCAYGANTCTDTPVDLPDMFENYMDYAPDSCTNLFTHDQIDLMRTMLIEERSNLYDARAPESPSDDTTTLIGKDQNLASSIQIAPNPTNGQVQIRADFQEQQDLKLELYNNIGQSLYKKSTSGSATIREQIDLTDQPKGMYILQVSTANKHVTKKVIRHQQAEQGMISHFFVF